MPEVLWRNLPFLLEGLHTTLVLALLSAALGTLLGLAIALLRHANVPVLGRLLGLYVGLIQGTPLLVVLFICYFAIPALLGYRTTAEHAAIMGFAFFTAAYLAEDFRAGLEGVRPGLVQAALATGLTPRQALRLVVVPQALRRSLPALFNQYVRLLKFTSVASVIGVTELTGGALLVNGRDFAPVTLIAAVALTYFVLCAAVSLAGRALYARLAVPG